jgi:hypothetical protein
LLFTAFACTEFLKAAICDSEVTFGYSERAMFCCPSIVKPVRV